MCENSGKSKNKHGRGYLRLSGLEVPEDVCKVHAVLVRDLVPAREQGRPLHQFYHTIGTIGRDEGGKASQQLISKVTIMSGSLATTTIRIIIQVQRGGGGDGVPRVQSWAQTALATHRTKGLRFWPHQFDPNQCPATDIALYEAKRNTTLWADIPWYVGISTKKSGIGKPLARSFRTRVM